MKTATEIIENDRRVTSELRWKMWLQCQRDAAPWFRSFVASCPSYDGGWYAMILQEAAMMRWESIPLSWMTA